MPTDWFVFLGDFSHDLATNMLYLMPVLAVLMAVGAWRLLRQTDDVVRELERAREQTARGRVADNTERRP